MPTDPSTSAASVPPEKAVSIIKSAAVHVEQAFFRDEQETSSLFSRTAQRRAEIAVGVLWDLGWRPPYLDRLPGTCEHPQATLTPSTFRCDTCGADLPRPDTSRGPQPLQITHDEVPDA